MHKRSSFCKPFGSECVKGFHLVGEMQGCITEFSKEIFLEKFMLVVFFSYSFISQERDKAKVPKIYGKHVIENLFLLFEVISCEHIAI